MNVSKNKANITAQFPVNLFPFHMIFLLTKLDISQLGW